MSDMLAQGPLPVRTRRGFSSHPAWLCGVLLILALGLARDGQEARAALSLHAALSR